MYISIGGDMAVREKSIIGIFDMDNTTCSRHTVKFLNHMEENGLTVSTTDDLPKAFVLTQEFSMERVYLTQFNPATLKNRLKNL